MRRHAIWCLWLAIGLASSGCEDDSQSDGADTTVDQGGDTTGDGADDVDADVLEVNDTATVDADDTSDADDAADVDVPVPADDFEIVRHTPRNPEVPPIGSSDVTEALAEGEVRAGIVTSWDHGFGGVEVDCRPGDYKIYNNRVQFCIAGSDPINLFTYAGGQVIDADRVGADNDRLFMATAQASLNVAGADTIEVLADGRDDIAVVNVRGGEEPFRLISDLVGMVFPPRGVNFETEYRLLPDVDYLEIITWLTPVAGPQRVSLGEVALLGDSSAIFTPGSGRERPAEGEVYPFLASTAGGRSYALYRAGGWENQRVDFSAALEGDYNVIVGERGLLPEGSEGALRRYLIVGDGGTSDLRATIGEISGQGSERNALIAANLDDEPMAGVHVVVRDDEGRPIDVIATHEQVTRLPLEPGDYTAELEDWPGGAITPVAFTLGADADVQVVIDLPEPALLAFDIEADQGGEAPLPSPAKVRLSGPVSDLLFIWDGTFEHDLPPGTYRLEISRGEEYTVEVVEALTLAAGQNPTVEVTLERVWNTEGLISGEFHQHMTASADSTVSDQDRLVGNLVEGVDFVVPTDHEAVTNFAPIIEDLGIEDLIYAMPSTEVSPLYGHLNPMPMTWDPALPANGAYVKASVDLDTWTIDRFSFPRIVSELRAMGVPVIQVNHPRDGFAIFDSGRYDPVAGPDAAPPDRFTTDFDTMEVFNTRRELCRIVDDWVGFIARGIPITGVGNSDTHSRNSPGGYPRNYLGSSNEAGTMDDSDIIDALLAGDVSVSGGALITFPGGPTLGQVVDASGDDAFELPVLIQTPVFASVDELLIIMDGDIVAQIPIDVADEEVVVYDDDVELTLPDHDTYVIAVAWGADPMQLVYPGERPFGFTNPIYLDVDGDDEWTPPGIASADDLPAIQIPWCE